MGPKGTGLSGRSASPERRAVGQPAPDALQAYFRRIGAVPLLTREEEVSIAKRIEAGERAILETLLRCEEGLVELGRLEAALRNGSTRVRDVLRTPDDEADGWEVVELQRVLPLLGSISRADATRRPGCGGRAGRKGQRQREKSASGQGPHRPARYRVSDGTYTNGGMGCRGERVSRTSGPTDPRNTCAASRAWPPAQA
jgi:hypothetical protein